MDAAAAVAHGLVEGVAGLSAGAALHARRPRRL